MPTRGEKLLNRKLYLLLLAPVFILFSLTCMTAKAGDPHIVSSRVAVLESFETTIDPSPEWQDYNKVNTTPVIYDSVQDRIVPITIPLKPLTELLAFSRDSLSLLTENLNAIEEPELPRTPLLSSVPLDGEVQWQIYTQACHEDPVRFCLVMAMANSESGYDPLKVGDNGDAIGLVQVQPKWHQSRLDKYGFTTDDLFDPVKCCIVSIDYLEELAGCPDQEFEVTHALLMRYNMGPSGAAKAMRNGHSSSYYSREVMPLYEQYLTEFALPTSELTS